MKTQHTPGEWKYCRTHVVLPDGSEIIQSFFSQDVEEVKANLKLIAAAPELLEALNELRNLIDIGYLVRDISKDDNYSYFLKQGLMIKKVIGLMNEAIKKAIE